MFRRVMQLGLVCMILSGSAFTAAAQGKKTPPPPQVMYKIAWIGSPYNLTNPQSEYYTFDMNNYGHVVGRVWRPSEGDTRNSAFVMYSPQQGLVDLNDFQEMLEWSTQGWKAVSAEGINDLGQIAVRMEKIVDGSVIKGMFRYDPPPTATELGNFMPIQQTGVCGTARINSWGDIAFQSEDLFGNCSWKYYRSATATTPGLVVDTAITNGLVCGVNDFGSIIGLSNNSLIQFDVFLDQTRVLGLSGSDKAGINNRGDVAFTRNVPKGKFFNQQPVRYDEQLDGLQILRNDGVAFDINADGDVCGAVNMSGGTPLLFPGEGGSVDINSQVTGLAADVNKWKSAGPRWVLQINDRDDARFNRGQLCGKAKLPRDGSYLPELFLLTPYIP